MKKQVKLLEGQNRNIAFDHMAEAEKAGKDGIELILEQPERSGREIWQIFEHSCRILSFYESEVEVIIRPAMKSRVKIRTEFGDLENELEVLEYSRICSENELQVILRYRLKGTDEELFFELTASDPKS